MNQLETLDDEEITQYLLKYRILAYGTTKGTYLWLAPLVKWIRRLKRLHVRYFRDFTEIAAPSTCDNKTFVRMETELGNKEILDFVYTFDGKVLVPTSESCLYGSSWFQNTCKKRSTFPLRLVMYSRVWRRQRKVTPLLRNTQITAFWECHTVHENYQESSHEAQRNAKTYTKFFQQLGLKTYVINRFKSDSFVGAFKTIALDLIIGQRRLQVATSHDLGDSYAQIFDLCTRDAANKNNFVWQTCHGMTERVLGGILHASIRTLGRIQLPKVLRLKELVTLSQPTDQDYAFYDIIHLLKNPDSLSLTIDQCLGRDSIVTLLSKADRSEATVLDRARRRKMFPEETYFYDSPETTVLKGDVPVRMWPVPPNIAAKEELWQQIFSKQLQEGQVLYGYDDMYVYGGPKY